MLEWLQNILRWWPMDMLEIDSFHYSMICCTMYTNFLSNFQNVITKKCKLTFFINTEISPDVLVIDSCVLYVEILTACVITDSLRFTYLKMKQSKFINIWKGYVFDVCVFINICVQKSVFSVKNQVYIQKFQKK